MALFEFCVAALFVYLCLYGLVNRVCKCMEHCATAKAYGKFVDTATGKTEQAE